MNTATSTARVFKTIRLGTGPSTQGFFDVLRRIGCVVGVWGSDTMLKITVKENETELDLVSVTIKELGCEGRTREEIYARAKDLGLEICPAEVGPQLRLQYLDQPPGERLYIGMEPIKLYDRNGDKTVVFCVGCEDFRDYNKPGAPNMGPVNYLHSRHGVEPSMGPPRDDEGGERRWIFVKPRQ